MRTPAPQIRLRNGRHWQAVRETPPGERQTMMFIKEGERYVTLEEQAAEAFYDERLGRWLHAWLDHG